MCVCVCCSIILHSARWPEESSTLTTTTVENVGFPSTQLNYKQSPFGRPKAEKEIRGWKGKGMVV